jgi:hypothetical protein
VRHEKCISGLTPVPGGAAVECSNSLHLYDAARRRWYRLPAGSRVPGADRGSWWWTPIWAGGRLVAVDMQGNAFQRRS